MFDEGQIHIQDNVPQRSKSHEGQFSRNVDVTLRSGSH